MVRVGSTSRKWCLRAAQVAHLYPPETIYWEKCRRHAEPAASAYIIFRDGEVSGLSPLIHPRARYGRFLDPEGKLGTLIETIARTGYQEGEKGFWKAQAPFCTIIDLLLNSTPVENETRLIKTPAPADTKPDLTRMVDAYLSKHLTEHVTLSALARHLNVSVSKLSHQYRRETGETPMTRLLEMRINLAKALIMKGQPLKAVAENTGFYDAFHLSHTFKQVTGMSPRAFLALMGR